VLLRDGIYLLLGYQKNVQSSLTASEKQTLKQWVTLFEEEI
jgi:hypothetical protein